MSAAAIALAFGFVTKITCEGRLLVSAVGNDAIVQVEALPKDVGCGVLIKPLIKSGTTNLILETSLGTITRTIEVKPDQKQAALGFEVFVKPEAVR